MLEFTVDGMTCGHCVRTVTQAVRTLDREAHVEVDLASKRVRVEGQPSSEELVQALDAAGYTAAPVAGGKPAVATRRGCCGG